MKRNSFVYIFKFAQAIAALGRDIIVANTFGSFVILVLFTLGGFVLSRDDVKKWWFPCYWVWLMTYGQNAVLVNEFLGQSWSHLLPSSKELLGVKVLKSRGFFMEEYWYWIEVGALLGYAVIFNIIYSLAPSFPNSFHKHQTSIPKGPENNETGGTQERDDEVGETISSQCSHEQSKGMVLPFEPFSITFNNIVYFVDMPQEMKKQGVQDNKSALLSGVIGAFRPGVLTALMAVNDAEKATLLDVLAERKTGGYIKGSIMISGYPEKPKTFARISGYCDQNDIHSPNVTVYESLLYSAWLRLPRELAPETRKQQQQQNISNQQVAPMPSIQLCNAKILHGKLETGGCTGSLSPATNIVYTTSWIRCSGQCFGTLAPKWNLQHKATRSFQCYGFNVWCCSLPWDPKFVNRAASSCVGTNGLLQKKGCRNVLCITICRWTSTDRAAIYLCSSCSV